MLLTQLTELIFYLPWFSVSGSAARGVTIKSFLHLSISVPLGARTFLILHPTFTIHHFFLLRARQERVRGEELPSKVETKHSVSDFNLTAIWREHKFSRTQRPAGGDTQYPASQQTTIDLSAKLSHQNYIQNLHYSTQENKCVSNCCSGYFVKAVWICYEVLDIGIMILEW